MDAHVIGKADEAARSSVTAFFGKVADTWKTNDGAATADFFTEDGSLINPFDERADGRAALAAGQVRARFPILICSLSQDRALPGVAVGGGQRDVEHEVIGAVDADRRCAEAARDR